MGGYKLVDAGQRIRLQPTSWGRCARVIYVTRDVRTGKSSSFTLKSSSFTLTKLKLAQTVCDLGSDGLRVDAEAFC